LPRRRALFASGRGCIKSCALILISSAERGQKVAPAPVLDIDKDIEKRKIDGAGGLIF